MRANASCVRISDILSAKKAMKRSARMPSPPHTAHQIVSDTVHRLDVTSRRFNHSTVMGRFGRGNATLECVTRVSVDFTMDNQSCSAPSTFGSPSFLSQLLHVVSSPRLSSTHKYRSADNRGMLVHQGDNKSVVLFKQTVNITRRTCYKC